MYTKLKKEKKQLYEAALISYISGSEQKLLLGQSIQG